MTSWIEKPVLVHVGLHKTATSWLQNAFFSAPGSGFWAPEVASAGDAPAKQAGYLFFRGDDGCLLNDEAFSAADVCNRLSCLVPPAGLVPVISNERLAGHPLSGGYDRWEIARRIRSVFPQARILVTIRSQEAVILSNYLQYLKYGGWHKPELYLKPPGNARTPSLTLAFWDYERLAQGYEAIFGTGNVLLLPQELLRSDPHDFVRRLAGFAGAAAPAHVDSGREVNPRRAVAAAYHLRRLTWLRNKSAANAFAPPILSRRVERIVEIGLKSAASALIPDGVNRRVAQSLDLRIRTMVGERYAAGNRRLSAALGIDLGAMGYTI